MTDTPPHNITNLVFDFGAVLFRWQPVQLLAQHFPEHADTPERAAQLARSMFLHADWEAFDSGTATLEHTVLRSAARLGLAHAPLDAMVRSIPEHLQPMEGTVALLQRLHRRRLAAPPGEPSWKLYFLSNMSQPYARYLERKHGFLSCFDGGVFSGDVQLVKPDAAIYARLEDRHALAPARTLFIDDLAVNIAAAKARGWQAVQFESAEQLEVHLQAIGIRLD